LRGEQRLAFGIPRYRNQDRIFVRWLDDCEVAVLVGNQCLVVAVRCSEAEALQLFGVGIEDEVSRRAPDPRIDALLLTTIDVRPCSPR
jgi:hypothetical protein